MRSKPWWYANLEAVTTAQVIASSGASALLIAAPGPSVLFVIGRALALGRFAAWLTAIGNAVGTFLLAGGVAVGLGPLLQRSETLLLVVGVVNPKSLVFFSAALPQIVNTENGAVPVQIAILGLIFATIALILDSGWALFAGPARGWFAKDPRRLRRTTQTGGIVMIGLGGGLAVETARR